jgi:hypothetical protein
LAFFEGKTIDLDRLAIDVVLALDGIAGLRFKGLEGIFFGIIYFFC